MIGKRMQDAMNEQIKHELESAYLYLSMVAYFHSESLDGMAQWMTVQAQEELAHAMKFFNHIDERDGRGELKALSQPQKEWASPLEAYKAAYNHERFITDKINETWLSSLQRKETTPLVSCFSGSSPSRWRRSPQR